MKAICFFDDPMVIDCTDVAIPGSGSPTRQVVASLPGYVTRIKIVDGIGDYVCLYEGPVGAEKLIDIIGGGTVTVIQTMLPPQTRISVRAEGAAAISTGSIQGTFFG